MAMREREVFAPVYAKSVLFLLCLSAEKNV